MTQVLRDDATGMQVGEVAQHRCRQVLLQSASRGSVERRILRGALQRLHQRGGVVVPRLQTVTRRICQQIDGLPRLRRRPGTVEPCWRLLAEHQRRNQQRHPEGGTSCEHGVHFSPLAGPRHDGSHAMCSRIVRNSTSLTEATMAVLNEFPLEGGCDCGAVRYRMETAPLIVHCCHCRWCQRETGASFALNALIEVGSRHESRCRTGDRRHAVGQRPRAADCALPALPHCGVEPLRRRGPACDVRARRHAGSAGPTAARHSYLHGLEAAVGRDPSGHARGARVLRTRRGVDPGKPRARRRAASPGPSPARSPVSDATARGRRLLERNGVPPHTSKLRPFHGRHLRRCAPPDSEADRPWR